MLKVLSVEVSPGLSLDCSFAVTKLRLRCKTIRDQSVITVLLKTEVDNWRRFVFQNKNSQLFLIGFISALTER